MKKITVILLAAAGLLISGLSLADDQTTTQAAPAAQTAAPTAQDATATAAKDSETTKKPAKKHHAKKHHAKHHPKKDKMEKMDNAAQPAPATDGTQPAEQPKQ